MQKIECAVIDGKKYFAFVLSYIIIGTLLSTAIAWKSHHFFFVWIGLVIFWVFPGIFQKQFQKPFSTQAAFNFSPGNLQVQLFSSRQAGKEYEIAFSDIASFRAIESFKDDSAYLKLFLRDGSSFKYNLIGQNKKENVVELIFAYFNDYNNSKPGDQHKITLRPSLFSTQTGKVFIVGLSILLLICLAVQIIYLPKSIPASGLTGLVFYVIILQQRRKDIQLNKRMKD